MFDSLSDRLQDVLRDLSGKGRLSEQDVEAALRQVRLALLEADVNYKVAKAFVERIRERAVGLEVQKSLTPAQQVVKIVHQELVDLLGEHQRLELGGPPPHVLMLVGLHGAGKTTTAGKLARRLGQGPQLPLLVAADIKRPAAVEQLQQLGRQLNIPVHIPEPGDGPPEVCRKAVRLARSKGYSPVLVDTAGRRHVDEELMAELVQIKADVEPQAILLVADSMTGQDAVRLAESFQQRLDLTGLVLTKVDGDARGGAALSMRSVTGVPILFLGTGERLEALEAFHPDRLASRILGMGDVLTLIERAEQAVDQDKARAFEQKLRTATFDLEDFLSQMQEVKKLGPMSQLLGMLPGLDRLGREMPQDMPEREMKKIEAMIYSMTSAERRNPQSINASRKRRIARGSGTQVQDVNQLLSQFRQAQKLVKMLQGSGPRGLMGLVR